MEVLSNAVWDVLTAAGGTLALTLIIAIALGINALTLLFFGSAVIALEQFARVAVRWRSLLICAVVASGLVGVATLYFQAPELSAQAWSVWFKSWALASAFGGVVVTVAMLIMRLLLRYVASRHLATASLVVLGLGYAVVLGASGRIAYAAAPTLVAALAAAALAVRRRRKPVRPPRSEVERLLRVLGGALAIGSLTALALSSPETALATGGVTMLGVYVLLIGLGLLPLAAAGLIDTRGSAEWFIAIRYLTAKRRQTFISIITGICVVGIAAGVWLLITVMSVMNGFERTWREEIIGNRAHFTVHSRLGPFADYEKVIERVASVPGVVATSPYLDADGMVRRGERIMAVRLRGIDPARVGTVTDLRQDMVYGSVDDLLAETPDNDDPGIVIGSQLASAVGAELGASLLLISPFGGPPTPLGPGPRLARFRVVGVFESSFFQYDEMFTFVHLTAAQDFKRTGDVIDGIEARTTDSYRSQKVATAVSTALGFPYYAQDWKQFFPAFFQALKSERVMMFVLLTMIMVVAAFSIVSTLVMMIMEKSGDIAILKTMGARDETVERIFAIEGTLIGLVGTVLGVIAGVSVTRQIAWVQHQIEAVVGFDALPASVYQFSTLPAELDAGHIAVAVGIAMVLALGATLLPSRQGARLDPVEALRYE